MLRWCSRHPVWFMAAYLVVYLAVFSWQEAHLAPAVWVHSPLDDLIPFCKYAVLPYFAWFAWIPLTLFWLLRGPRADFMRLCLPLFSGMTLALMVYLVLPTGLALRPGVVPGQDIFAQAVRWLYATDTPTNVCPSIHVFNSVTLALAYSRSEVFAGPRRRWLRCAAWALCVSICASTMLLKQHSCIDAALGLALALAVDSAASALWRTSVRARAEV